MERIRLLTLFPDEAPGSAGGAAALPIPKAEHRFNYRGWDIVIQLDGMTAEGCVSGHAELRAGNYSCRLMLAGRHEDGASAIAALGRKSRALIDDREALAALSTRENERPEAPAAGGG